MTRTARLDGRLVTWRDVLCGALAGAACEVEFGHQLFASRADPHLGELFRILATPSRRVTRILRSDRAVGDVALWVRWLASAAVLSIGLAACATIPGGGPANACQLPAYSPGPEEGVSNGPPVVVRPGCTVVLGPNDDGRRLTVDPGTLISVSLPDSNLYSPPTTPDPDNLTPVDQAGQSASFRAAVPGEASISAGTPNWHGPRSAPTAWSVVITVTGVSFTEPRFTSASVGWALGTVQPGIFRSTDGGRTWANVAPSDLKSPVRRSGSTTWQVGFVTDLVAWVAVQRVTVVETFRTADGGVSWTAGELRVGASPELLDLSAADADHAWLLAATIGSLPAERPVLRTADGGRTWQEVGATAGGTPSTARQLRNDCAIPRLVFASVTTGYATSAFACSPLLLDVTRDGGVAWSRQPLPVPAAMEANMSAGGGCIAGPAFSSPREGRLLLLDSCVPGSPWPARINSQLYVTHDGGASWSPVAVPGAPTGRGTMGAKRPRPATADDLAYFVDAQHGWTWSGADLLRTTDGGATWARLPLIGTTVTALGSVQFTSPTDGLAFDDSTGRLLATADGGQSWRILPRPLTASTPPGAQNLTTSPTRRSSGAAPWRDEWLT